MSRRAPTHPAQPTQPMPHSRRSLALGSVLALTLLGAPARAQVGDSVSLPLVGAVRPRAAREIRASNWSIGAETMDRDFTVYRNWRQYLGPLGVKKARIQAGWARTEREPGVYDWAWLDEIVNDMVAQGVEPWVNVGYGNLLYAGGGGARLGGGLPDSEEALVAWERWVRAMVGRYRDRVDEWEVWNEASAGHVGNGAAAYANLLVRTAAAIRAVQPKAKIVAMANAGIGLEYTDSVLTIVGQRKALGLIDEVTYHPYAVNPDETYDETRQLRELAARHARHITIRQGENGAPSDRRATYALANHDWTELTQAKWALRRLLGDLGRDIPSSYFGIIDMKYPNDFNTKGLLRAADDKTVAYVKPAYRAVQHLTAVFDDRLRRIPTYTYRASTDRSLSVFGYAHTGTGQHVVTVWLDGAEPSDSNAKTPVDFTITGGRFRDPVWVDLREGTVRRIPAGSWSRRGSTHVFRGIPVYDSPVLIADRSAIPLRAVRR